MKNKTLLRGLRYASIAFAVIATILRIFATLCSYDTDTHYFADGAILPALSVIAAFLGAAVGTVAAYLTVIDASSMRIFPARVSTVGLLPTIGFGASAVLFAVHFFVKYPSTVSILTALFTGLSAFYAIAVAIPSIRSHTTATAALGFLPPIACILYNAHYYFDATIEMNAPIKTSAQVGLLCAMLYLVAEVRFLLGTPQPRVFLALTAWLCCFGALSALPLIKAIIGSQIRMDYFAGAILTFSLMLTAIVRARRLLRAEKTDAADSEQPTVED